MFKVKWTEKSTRKLKKFKTVWIIFLQDQKSDTFWFEHFSKFVSFKHCLACKLKWSNRGGLAFLRLWKVTLCFFSPFYLKQSLYRTAKEIKTSTPIMTLLGLRGDQFLFLKQKIETCLIFSALALGKKPAFTKYWQVLK